MWIAYLYNRTFILSFGFYWVVFIVIVSFNQNKIDKYTSHGDALNYYGSWVFKFEFDMSLLVLSTYTFSRLITRFATFQVIVSPFLPPSTPNLISSTFLSVSILGHPINLTRLKCTAHNTPFLTAFTAGLLGKFLRLSNCISIEVLFTQLFQGVVLEIQRKCIN